MSATVTAMPSHHEPLSDAHEQRALGFWLYLMGDAVLFGLLFMTYGSGRTFRQDAVQPEQCRA